MIFYFRSMKPALIALFILTVFAAPAQKTEQYFNYLWKPCYPTFARFYSLTEKTDSGWGRRDYFIHEKALQMVGLYEDSSCQIPNGSFYFFNAAGKLQSAGINRHGKKEGLWLSYHNNGMMSDSIFYADGNPSGTSFAWYENGYLHDSSVYNADGSGVEVSWFDNGNESQAGRFSAGRKMNGKWQFFHANGQVSSLETYQDGALLNKQYFNEDGSTLADTTNKDKLAEFKGGMSGWQHYLEKHLYFPDQYRFTNGDSAIVVVTGTIDETGKMTNVYVSTPFYPAFDKIALSIVSKSPLWSPAIRHNRKVKFTFSQAVSFVQESN